VSLVATAGGLGTVPLTKLVNILQNSENFTLSPWIAGNAPTVTTSSVTFNGAGNQYIRQQNIPLTAGMEMLCVIRLSSPTIYAASETLTYPSVHVLMYDNTAGQWMTPDTGNQSQQLSVRTTKNNMILRYPIVNTGNHIFQLSDNGGNPGTYQLDYDFAGMYDIAGMTGILYDDGLSANHQLFNMDKTLVIWGDSMPDQGVHWDLRTTIGTLPNVFDGAEGGETSSQILSRFNIRPDLHSEPTIFWVGQNDFNTNSQAVLQANIKAMTDQMMGDYRVLSLTYNKANWTTFPTTKGVALTYIDDFNSWALAQYGTRYIDVNANTLLGTNGDATDTAEVAVGQLPTSLRADSVHPHIGGISWIVDGPAGNDDIMSSIGNSWR